ncbi:hypothetical protein [Hymenobacter armeniacus]|uniref:YtxH domain-containing protein n=1 Tax=Hymenobacter armeniacus TaxID=2771358 RepID=A0ABR8JQ96_9BACT|nr:hypothetical protein [Hymenobacter armeniacus]MBD2721091.1 hypothetical protein [Hymenobacter armeniacus]
MKTPVTPPRVRRPALAQWSAFGASMLAGLTAGLLWAPASGRHARTRLTAGLRDWSRTVAGRWNLWPLTLWPLVRRPRHPAAPGSTRPAPNLALRPDRLLTED